MDKKIRITILYHSGGELANQLWNYVSAYAYALERNAELENYSFYEYGGAFQIPVRSFWARILLFRPFRNFRGRKQDVKPRMWRLLYRSYAALVRMSHKNILTSQKTQEGPYYLPPTKTEDEELRALERSDALYLNGWLFRNPVGLKKYRKEILGYFQPNTIITQRVMETISPLRSRFSKVVGVHIRQGDYKTWRDGSYFVPPVRTAEILREYLDENGLRAEDVCFIIASDGKVEPADFHGLHVWISKENAVTDLFLLAECDAVLGSDSTFGDFAAWWGDIPHIVLQNDLVDWEFYRGKPTFFENRYCTMTHY